MPTHNRKVCETKHPFEEAARALLTYVHVDALPPHLRRDLRVSESLRAVHEGQVLRRPVAGRYKQPVLDLRVLADAAGQIMLLDALTQV